MKPIACGMRQKLVAVGIFLILILTMGCILQSPGSNPSYSVLPKILLDYDFETDETKIWVNSALGDFRYENITIEISNNNQKQVIIENNTYSVSTFIKHKVFNLNIIVISEDKKFGFNCKIDVDLSKDLIIITIYDETTGKGTEEDIQKDNLPFKKILEELKED